MLALFGKYRNMFLIVGAVVIAFFVYSYFFTGSSAPSGPLTVSNTNESSVASAKGQELVSLLARLKVINLDPSLLDDPILRSLSDFEVTLQPLPKGRKNPFLP